jgi:hypothetical protein
MSDRKKPAAAALRASQQIVRSQPTKQPATIVVPDFAEFERYGEACDQLRDYIEDISECEHGETPYYTADELQAAYDEFDASRRLFEHTELYCLRQPRSGGECYLEISQRVVSQQLADLLHDVPPAPSISNPKRFSQQLLEYVMAENPYWSVLEATRRQMVKSKSYCTIAEVLHELKTQTQRWRQCVAMRPDDLARWKQRITDLEAVYVAQRARAEEQQQQQAERERMQQERVRQECAQRERMRHWQQLAKADAARVAATRKHAEGKIIAHTVEMRRQLERAFIWRYFMLLLWSRGIFIRYETLIEFREEKYRQVVAEFERERERQRQIEAFAHTNSTMMPVGKVNGHCIAHVGDDGSEGEADQWG